MTDKPFSAMLDRLLDGEALKEREAYELMMNLAEGDMEPALAGAPLARSPASNAPASAGSISPSPRFFMTA